MKLSQKIQEMELSPIRKFVPYADQARAAGKKVYGLNIGQPDIKTPRAFFDAVQNFDQEVLAYANSQGIPELLEALVGYYKRIGLDFEKKDLLITNGGSEALSMIMTAILDPGDEVIMAEPFYTNYKTFIKAAGGPYNCRRRISVCCKREDRRSTYSQDQGYRHHQSGKSHR